MNDRLNATKRADLLSLSGATVAGTAVGALFPAVFAGAAVPLLLVGLLVHAVGMSSRFRIDSATGKLPPVWRGLYAACWVTLAAVLAFVAWRTLAPGG